jgi:hypothetical protein
MIKITLPGSIRSKKNSKRIVVAGKFKRILPSKAYLTWEKEARQSIQIQLSSPQIKSSVKKQIPTGQDISVKALIYYRGPKPDLSGSLESIGDCGEGLLWLNDRQIISWDGSRLIHDLENPRTDIEITSYRKSLEEW